MEWLQTKEDVEPKSLSFALDPARLQNEIPPKILRISRAISDAGGECYLVGGWVRDQLLGLRSKDYDIEVHKIHPDKLEKLLSGFGRVNPVGKSFGILLMSIGGVAVDFALPRRERKVGVGHRDFSVDTDPMMGFEEASSRRDFTINSMGIKLPQMELCDPHNGERDLKQRLLRHVGPAFSEDPLRALRGAQFAARFELSVDPDTVELCAQQDLSVLSAERIDEEFRKLLLKPNRPSIGLRAMREMRLLRFFPELQLCRDQWEFTLRSCDAAAQERARFSDAQALLLLLTSLCSTLSPEKSSLFLERITRDKRLLQTVPEWVSLIPQLLSQTVEEEGDLSAEKKKRGWLRRLSLKIPISLAAALLRSQLVGGQLPCDRTGERFIEQAKEVGVWDGPPKPWVQGRDLIALGMQPGPQMGELVRELFEKQLDEEFNGREAALEWLQKQL